MLRRSIAAATILIALTCASGVVWAQTAPPQKSPTVEKKPAAHGSARTAKRGKKSKEPEAIFVAPAPVAPPTPEQMPAVAPEVIYRSGMLTINAPNSTMNDVLSAVRRVTGATIEKPPIGGNDRVVAHLGPGQPNDVLGSLFNGSRYDYIILGSMTRPGGVERIVLTARANGGSATSVATNNPAQPANPRPAQAQPADQDQEEQPETDTEDMTVPERDQSEPEQPDQQQLQQQQQQQPPQQPQGLPVQPPQEQPQQGQNPDQNQQPHVKSPDELLRELQQMQKQPPDQNQQQQEQPPPQ